MTKVNVISGFLGAGKTTLIKKLLDEALRGLSSPQFIMLFTNDGQFEAHVEALEKRFPGVPSIGCIGMCYLTDVVEHGVGVIAYSDGVTAAANVLEEVSTAPVKWSQFPLGEMPIRTGEYLARSMCVITAWADSSEILYSGEQPPNRTATLYFFISHLL